MFFFGNIRRAIPGQEVATEKSDQSAYDPNNDKSFSGHESVTTMYNEEQPHDYRLKLFKSVQDILSTFFQVQVQAGKGPLRQHTYVKR